MRSTPRFRVSSREMIQFRDAFVVVRFPVLDNRRTAIEQKARLPKSNENVVGSGVGVVAVPVMRAAIPPVSPLNVSHGAFPSRSPLPMKPVDTRLRNTLKASSNKSGGAITSQ